MPPELTIVLIVSPEVPTFWVPELLTVVAVVFPPLLTICVPPLFTVALLVSPPEYTICVSPEETVPPVDTVPEIFTANAFSIVETTANTSSVFFARTKPCPLANSEATTQACLEWLHMIL